MTTSLLQIILLLLIGVALIVVCTTRFRLHPFFALLLAACVVGLGVGFPFADTLNFMKEGFGHVLKSLGFIIVLGTALGVILEKTGSTTVMASFILNKVGKRNAPLAMSLTGFLVGLPIFCDSGYIVLSGLNNSLTKSTGTSPVVMAVSLATGLYAVHCLLPPHPGATAAAGTLGVDIGRMIITGIAIAVPAAIVGYLWAIRAGKKEPVMPANETTEDVKEIQGEGPSVTAAFLPVIVPILLIALRSFLTMEGKPANVLQKTAAVLGEPIVALTVGILLALPALRFNKKTTLPALLHDAVEKAGSILLIIGAGGAFGAVLAATKLGQHLSEALSLGSLGLFFPFLLTTVLKTAQGSSTVAIITAASIVQPLLPALGLASPNGSLLAVLAMGAGSMMVSHANDAYFWVIAKFSGLETKPMLRVYTTASVLMGIVSLLAVYLLSLFLL